MRMDLTELERSVGRLRRRMAWERACFSIALLGTLGTLGYPRYFPPACTLVVGNRPLVAVADRETAERVLQAVAHAKTPGAEQKAVGSGQSAVGSPDGESAGSRADT